MSLDSLLTAASALLDRIEHDEADGGLVSREMLRIASELRIEVYRAMRQINREAEERRALRLVPDYAALGD